MAEEVRAELVANVGQIIVSVGDVIAEGEPVMILESMKMEIPVVAEFGGTVTAVAVTVGQVVQQGDLLVELS